KLQQEVESLRRGRTERQAAYPPGERGDALEEIRNRLAEIERRLPPPSRARTAFSPPAGLGRVAVGNYRPADNTVRTNNVDYRVPAMRTLSLEGQPLGTFVYEVISPSWGPQGRRVSTVLANDPLTINVR